MCTGICALCEDWLSLACHRIPLLQLAATHYYALVKTELLVSTDWQTHSHSLHGWVNSALHLSGVAKSSTSFGWGNGRNVTSAGWQVTPCDPMWHVSSRSGVATLRTAIHLLLTYLLTYGGAISRASRGQNGGRVTLIEVTRNSAIAEGLRDASCQLKSCQLPRNSAETTCTTSPEPSISCR